MPANEISPIEPAFTPADFTSLRLIIPFLHGQQAAAAIQELSAAQPVEQLLKAGDALEILNVLKQAKLCAPPAS
jgi:hypothetical protein